MGVQVLYGGACVPAGARPYYSAEEVQRLKAHPELRKLKEYWACVNREATVYKSICGQMEYALKAVAVFESPDSFTTTLVLPYLSGRCRTAPPLPCPALPCPVTCDV